MESQKTELDKKGFKNTEGVRAVTRALEILEAFNDVSNSFTVAELLQRVDLNRATLYRLLYTLEDAGYIISEGEPQRFRLGRAVARLAYRWLSGGQMVDTALPYLNELWMQTDETVAFLAHRATVRVCLNELESNQPLSYKRGVGYTEHLAKGASGKVILAYLENPDWIIDDYFRSAELTAERQQLVEQLAAIKRQGFAVSRNELINGAVAIAAPVFNSIGQVAGSVAVFGPSARLNENRMEEVIQQLLLVTKKINEQVSL